MDTSSSIKSKEPAGNQSEHEESSSTSFVTSQDAILAIHIQPFDQFLQACSEGDLQTVMQMYSDHRFDINRRGPGGTTAILAASLNGHKSVFDFLKENGADITVKDGDKNSCLHVACIKDNVEFVKYLLSLNIADVNVKGQFGRTPIMFAAKEGCRKVVDLLMAEGADIRMKDHYENTILHVACLNDNDEFVKYLLSLKFLHVACLKDNYEFMKYLLCQNIAGINLRGQDGKTPMMFAAEKGCRKVFDFLMTEGADIKVQDDNNNTILHVACLNDNDEFVKYLLSLNIADVNAKGQFCRTPIMFAAREGCRKVFDLLMTEGADIKVKDDDKNTILHVACLNDNEEFVKYLLSHNIAHIDIRGQFGRTPIMIAVQKRCRQVFDLLMSQGANVRVQNDNKNTILHVACFKDDVEFVKYLLSLNIIDINGRGHHGRTPIMLAAHEGCRQVFDLLMANGADIRLQDDHRNTILHVACLNDNHEFVKYLLSLNIAGINLRGQSGKTPIMIAAEKGCRKVFDLLMSEGADISVRDEKKNRVLHVACINDNDEFVKHLLSLKNSDINVKGQCGRTPIMIAAQKRCRKVFDLLMAEGADVRVHDDDKNTILHVACLNDNKEFVKYLLSFNIVDINVRGCLGRTPIMFAAEMGCRQVFDLLMAEGADVRVEDYQKNTILHVSCLNDNVGFVKYLLSLNIVDINKRGKRNRTPVMIATERGCGNVFDLLIAEGADITVQDNMCSIIDCICRLR